MQVGEYCNKEVIIMGKYEAPLEAACLMRKHNVGDVIIVEDYDNDKTPVGIITDRDIVLEIVALEVDPMAISVIDITRRPFVTVNETDDICECTVHMKYHGVRRAPVVNDRGFLVGIITIDDIVEILSDQLNDVVSLVSYQQDHEHRLMA